MNPLRLALRTLLLGQPRARLAMLLIACALCALDLFAGHLAGKRSQLEYQAVVGERLGHLAIVPRRGHGFGPAAAEQARLAVQGVRGVALVVPQASLSGVAASATASTMFLGSGEEQLAQQLVPAVQAPGRLEPGRRNGIALSDGQALSLGVGYGSEVLLTAAAARARVAPLKAQVVDIYSGKGMNADARNLLMPLGMAQELLDQHRVERLAVFLSGTARLETRRRELAAALAKAGIAAEVRSWRDLSPAYARENWALELQYGCAALAMLVLVTAAVAATLSVGVLERRRELATLRALGMRRRALLALLLGEAVWMAVVGVLASLMASGLLAWIVNRAAQPFATQPGMAAPAMLVELDPGRTLAMIAAVLAATLLAALVPALKAAQSDLAGGLSLSPRPGW